MPLAGVVSVVSHYPHSPPVQSVFKYSTPHPPPPLSPLFPITQHRYPLAHLLLHLYSPTTRSGDRGEEAARCRGSRRWSGTAVDRQIESVSGLAGWKFAFVQEPRTYKLLSLFHRSLQIKSNTCSNIHPILRGLAVMTPCMVSSRKIVCMDRRLSR